MNKDKDSVIQQKTNAAFLLLFSWQVMDFSAEMVATFIAVVGILSVVAQTALLSLLMKKLSNKHVIMVRNHIFCLALRIHRYFWLVHLMKLILLIILLM